MWALTIQPFLLEAQQRLHSGILAKRQPLHFWLERLAVLHRHLPLTLEIALTRSPVDSGNSRKTLDRTLASLVYSGNITKMKAAKKPKAGIGNSHGPTTTNFLAISSLVDSGDSIFALESPVNS